MSDWDRPAGRAHRAVPPALLPTGPRRGDAAPGGAGRDLRGTLPAAKMEPPTHRTGYLITYGDGIRRPGRGAPAHPGRLPAQPCGGPAQRRPPAADLPVDLRRRVRGRRPPGGQPRPRHLGRRQRPRGGARRDARLRRQPHLQPQPVVPGLARRRPVPRRLLRGARPRLRHLAGRAASNHPAVPSLPSAGRPGDRGLDDVRPRPGRRRRPRPEDPRGAHRRAARVRREGRGRGAAGRDRLPLEGVGHLLPAPAPDPCGDQDVASAGGARGTGHAVADGDQRAACREHLLLRRRR